MSKSLSSIKNKDLKDEAIRRRINSGSAGLGYWAAVDALKHNALPDKDGLLSKANEARSKLDNWTLRQS